MYIQRISQNEFIQEFKRMGRGSQFTKAGLESLYNHLEYFAEENNEPIELDVIELCRDFVEYEDIEEYNKDYHGDDHESYESLEDIQDYQVTILIEDNNRFTDGFIINTFKTNTLG